MKNQIITKDYIGGILNTSGFAVLATEDNSQPHVSLIAITPLENCRQLIFATYRNTLKYKNISKNNKVAVLIESGDDKRKFLQKSTVLTIIGHTEEISLEEYEAAYHAHLKRHPEMESFMLSSECALIMVIAHSYQVINGIDDIRWITTEDLDAT
jgi:uncharacterized pyridoxamine 5'-phosphate oxidase family protein